MGKRRKKGEGSVRQRNDGRWEGRVVIGYDEKGRPPAQGRPLGGPGGHRLR